MALRRYLLGHSIACDLKCLSACISTQYIQWFYCVALLIVSAWCKIVPLILCEWALDCESRMREKKGRKEAIPWANCQ